MGGSFLGGHAVGDFADELVKGLNARGYSEMVGAIVVSLFSGIASYLMIVSAHVKGKVDLALSNVSGAVTQMPFVVLPATLLMMAVLAYLGVIPRLPHGGVLAIDLETTSVLLFGFPSLLILWKSIADDGKVNKLETTVMVAMFGLVIYLLAQHG
jgi:Ca2+/H+ antiporter